MEAREAVLDGLGGVSIFLGSNDFAAQSVVGLGPLAEVPRDQWQPVRTPLAELLAGAGNAGIAAAYREHAYTMREIAEHLGMHYATVSRRLGRYESQLSDRKT